MVAAIAASTVFDPSSPTTLKPPVPVGTSATGAPSVVSPNSGKPSRVHQPERRRTGRSLDTPHLRAMRQGLPKAADAGAQPSLLSWKASASPYTHRQPRPQPGRPATNPGIPARAAYGVSRQGSSQDGPLLAILVGAQGGLIQANPPNGGGLTGLMGFQPNFKPSGIDSGAERKEEPHHRAPNQIWEKDLS